MPPGHPGAPRTNHGPTTDQPPTNHGPTERASSFQCRFPQTLSAASWRPRVRLPPRNAYKTNGFINILKTIISCIGPIRASFWVQIWPQQPAQKCLFDPRGPLESPPEPPKACPGLIQSPLASPNSSWGSLRSPSGYPQGCKMLPGSFWAPPGASESGGNPPERPKTFQKSTQDERTRRRHGHARETHTPDTRPRATETSATSGNIRTHILQRPGASNPKHRERRSTRSVYNIYIYIYI